MSEYKVKNLMVPNVEVISKDRTLKEAAEAMARIDCGVMPVGTKDHLVGMITDRDIAIRAIARCKDPAKTKISEVMSNQVYSVNEDDDVERAADIIKDQKINRLIVKNKQGKLVGIFSLSGLIRENADKQAIASFAKRIAERSHKRAA